MTSTVPSELEDASQLLLLSSGVSSEAREVCHTLLSVGNPNVIVITLTQSATSWLEAFWNSVESDPERMVRVIAVGESANPDLQEEAMAGATDDFVSTAFVPGPSNLTKIGTHFVEFLSELEEAAAPIAMCLDSITPLLQYADTKTVYRFLYTLGGHVRASDANVHFHVDPKLHDDETIALIKSLVDAAVDVDESGNWEIRSQRSSPGDR